MIDDDDGDESPSPEPRTDSRSALLREIRAWRRLRVVKRDETFSLIFFLPKTVYMELELRSGGVQGAHEIGGAPYRGAPPCLVDRPWAPWCISFAQKFFLLLLELALVFSLKRKG